MQIHSFLTIGFPNGPIGGVNNIILFVFFKLLYIADSPITLLATLAVFYSRIYNL
jgi:hypothetical protein